MERTVSNLVRKYYEAYERKERKIVEDLLTDDFTFTSPYDDRIDRTAYFEKCWPNSADIRAFHIESLLDDGREALVRYTLETRAGAQIRNTERFRSDGTKISAIEVYFGALPTAAPKSDTPAHSSDDGEQQYLCLVYHEPGRLEAMPQSEMDRLVGECIEWVDELERAGRHVFSAGLQSVHSATTVRRRNGTVSTTDGPFAETKEHLGGFTLLRARDLNEAIHLASNLPVAKIGTVEVRPVLHANAQFTDVADRKVAAALRRNDRAAMQPDTARPTGEA
jgi:ketosteroid isomerase-like protein